MQDRIENLERRLAEMERRVDAITRRSRRRMAGAGLAVCLALAWAATPEARAQFGITLAGLNARLDAVESKTAPLSTAGTTLTISGVNVRVVDGTGSTQSNSGLGNLTVGYNALRGDGTDDRSGSHNLIVGDHNNYANFFGGVVAGYNNTISGSYATVGGGYNNTASGAFSSVSGGNLNTASGTFSSVSGGSGRSALNDSNWAAGALFQSK